MRYLLPIVLTALLAVPAHAAEGAVSSAAPAEGGFQGPGAADGFQKPVAGVRADTVAKALAAANKSPVVLTGQVVERVAGKDDKYLFQDHSGKIMVEIDQKVFAGREITPQSNVRLFGKLKKYRGKPVRVDVSVLQVLQ